MWGWLAPNKLEESGRMLVRCSCGRVMWLDAPQEVRGEHDGHHLRPCSKASLWVFVKMKLGWLDRLTWAERMTRRMRRLA